MICFYYVLRYPYSVQISVPTQVTCLFLKQPSCLQDSEGRTARCPTPRSSLNRVHIPRSPIVSHFIDGCLGSEWTAQCESKGDSIHGCLLVQTMDTAAPWSRSQRWSKALQEPIEGKQNLVINEWCRREFAGAAAFQTKLSQHFSHLDLPPSFVLCFAPFLFPLQMIFLLWCYFLSISSLLV